jgi:hypothetical protein
MSYLAARSPERAGHTPAILAIAVDQSRLAPRSAVTYP